MADAAVISLVWLILCCSPDCLLSSSVLQAKRSMEEVVMLKEAVAAAMGAMATPLMDASEKNAGEEERKPPEGWMADDVSSSERLNHVWMSLVCWWVTENANLNLNGIWSWS